MADKKEAAPRYLQDASGEVRLYSGADIDAGLATGLKEPTSTRANGEPWNAVEVEEDERTQEMAIGDMLKTKAERDAKIAARKAKEAEEARKQAEKTRAEGPTEDVIVPRPDFRVEVVNPADPNKTGTSKK